MTGCLSGKVGCWLLGVCPARWVTGDWVSVRQGGLLVTGYLSGKVGYW